MSLFIHQIRKYDMVGLWSKEFLLRNLLKNNNIHQLFKVNSIKKNKQRHWDQVLLCINSIWDEWRPCASAVLLDRQVNIDLVKLPAYKHLSCLDQWPNKTNIDCNYHIVKNLYKETQNQNQYEPISKLLTPLRTAHVRFSAT